MKKILAGSLTLFAVALAAAPTCFAAGPGFDVPDAGATFILLATSVCGLGIARRIFGRKK
jgi:hypothetical protein